MNNGTEYLTPQEVSDILKVHINTVYRYIDNGRLSAFKLADSKILRIRRSDLDKFVTDGGITKDGCYVQD